MLIIFFGIAYILITPLAVLLIHFLIILFVIVFTLIITFTVCLILIILGRGAQESNCHTARACACLLSTTAYHISKTVTKMLMLNPTSLSGPGRGWGAHLLGLLSYSLGHDICLARA